MECFRAKRRVDAGQAPRPGTVLKCPDQTYGWDTLLEHLASPKSRADPVDQHNDLPALSSGSPRQLISGTGEIKTEAANLVLYHKDTFLEEPYLVLGIVGRRCSGKSTLLNALVSSACFKHCC